jgi:hypothetical protein
VPVMILRLQFINVVPLADNGILNLRSLKGFLVLIVGNRNEPPHII